MKAQLHCRSSIDRFAAEVGLSPSRLGVLFRQCTGMSPGAYLHALRMDHARVLVETTTLSVRDIMAQVGLADPSHFARDFRNAHGLSPRSYRLQVRLAGPPARYVTTTRRAPVPAADLQANSPSGSLSAATRTGNIDPAKEDRKK